MLWRGHAHMLYSQGIRNPMLGNRQFQKESAAVGIGSLPITVLMNAVSGSEDKTAAEIAIEATLKSSGRDYQLVLARRPRELSKLAKQAAERRPCILAAAGGDGTLNAVASVARELGLPLAVIPLGTFNYFARDLGIPTDTVEAVRLIVAGTVRRVPVGEVNGRLFLNNASIGLYRRLIEERESYKQQFGRNRLVALISALITVARSHRPYRLRMEIDGQSMTFSSLTMFFGRNALQMTQLGLDEAACVARGELAILALREVGRFELLALVLRGAFKALETAANLRQSCALRVDIDWLDGRSRKIRVAIDGELADCSLPLIIEVVPDALLVIVPRQPEVAR
jgi:diacylglycerol kinase family enzyme